MFTVVSDNILFYFIPKIESVCLPSTSFGLQSFLFLPFYFYGSDESLHSCVSVMLCYVKYVPKETVSYSSKNKLKRKTGNCVKFLI